MKAATPARGGGKVVAIAISLADLHRLRAEGGIIRPDGIHGLTVKLRHKPPTVKKVERF